MMAREPKKSEMLEIRLTHEAKQAFMARAANEGRSASAIVRDFVGTYPAATKADRSSGRRVMIAAALAPLLAVASASALPPNAAPAQSPLESTTAKLDRTMVKLERYRRSAAGRKQFADLVRRLDVASGSARATGERRSR